MSDAIGCHITGPVVASRTLIPHVLCTSIDTVELLLSMASATIVVSALRFNNVRSLR